jgi:hypothetical protein
MTAEGTVGAPTCYMVNVLFINNCMVNCISEQMFFLSNVIWVMVFLGKCPFGKTSSGQMSFWAIVFLGKCPSRQMSSEQMYFGANVLLGKCSSGQMSSGQISFWAIVFLGNSNCLSGQMSF